MSEIVLLIDPAQGQQAPEFVPLGGHQEIRGVIELILKAGPDRPLVKQAVPRPVAPPQSLGLFEIFAYRDFEHSNDLSILFAQRHV